MNETVIFVLVALAGFAAAIAAFGRLFALTASAAQGRCSKSGGFNFLPALGVVFFAAIIGGAAFAGGDLSPLHYEALFGSPEIALAFIWAGADVNEKDDDGYTPLGLAATGGDIAEVKRLISGGANVNAKADDGWMPLHSAAAANQIKIALALVKAGADIEAKDNGGGTPLLLAAVLGKTEIALALVKWGADIEAKDDSGGTPLYAAALEGQTETALALVNAGADINELPSLDIARDIGGWNIALLEKLLLPKPSGKEAPNVATAPAPEGNNVAEHVFENAWRSVVYIEAGDVQGSGVIIKPNIVATNCHVVKDGGIVVYKSHNCRTDKSQKYRATVRYRDDKNDFCLLDVSGLWGVPADVRRYDTLRIGESVYGIGAPQGLDLSLTSGLISQKRTEGGVREIQTNVAISPGSSGGGLFDREGNLVGILTSKLVDEKVEGIGFAIPADLAIANQ